MFLTSILQRQPGNGSSFKFKIDSLKYYSNLATATKPQRFVPVIGNNSVGRKACLLHHGESRSSQSMFPVVTPHNHSPALPLQAVPFTQKLKWALPDLCMRCGEQNTCTLRKQKKKWITIVQTERDLVGPQRGSVTSVTQSISLGMWNGWEIIFHLYCEGYLEHELKIKHKFTSMYNPK